MLQGVSFDVSGGRRDRAPRPERSRQDDDAAGAHGARPTVARRRSSSTATTSPGCRRTPIVRRGVGYVPEDRDVFAGLTVDENLRLAVRGADARYDLVYELFPELRERGRAARRDALGRPAADGRDRAGAPERQRAPARRRADEGPRAAARGRGRGRARARGRADDDRCSSSRTSASCSASRARRRPRHRPRRPRRRRRPSSSPTPSAFSGCSASTEAGIEHLRPAHDHGARARRDVLPRRLGAVADLRADGRPQLRPRRADHRRRVRGVVVRRRRSAASRAQRVAPRPRSSGSSSARRSAALVELVIIRPLYRRPDRAGARHGRARARARRARPRGSGATTRSRSRCRAGCSTRRPCSARTSRTTAGSRSASRRSCSSGSTSFLRYTRFGLVIRAGVENRAMVTALGIDVRQAFTLVFAIGGALAALAGVLSGIYFGTVDPGRGTSLLIFAFIVVVIGGFGSIWGTAVAAVVVALVQQYANYYASRRDAATSRSCCCSPRSCSPGPAGSPRRWRMSASALGIAVPAVVLRRARARPEDRRRHPGRASRPPQQPRHAAAARAMLVFAGLALTYDLLFGFTGLLSFGHALYFARRRLRGRDRDDEVALGVLAGDRSSSRRSGSCCRSSPARSACGSAGSRSRW